MRDMKLAELLERLEYEIVQGTKETEITKVVDHSRNAVQGALFVCISGSMADGCSYVEEAVEKGAAAVVAERQLKVPDDVTLVCVSDARAALAKTAAAFYGYPAERMKLIGVTGTKGKTTTTYMIRHILECAGYKTGLIGTIEILTGKRRIPAKHTSPESLELQCFLREMADAGCAVVVMEVSSQGLKLHRVDGILFELGVFTNLGRDHISKYEHADFAEYKACKAKLFRQCRAAVANIDDRCFTDIFARALCEVNTVGCRADADYRITDEKLVRNGKSLGISYHISGMACGDICLSMPGRFNLYNSAEALAAARYFGVPMETVKSALAQVQVRGRVENADVPGEFTLIIDYAHNAMSLQSILEMVHSYHPQRVVCIFGCGGNRAKDRRYEMGEVSGRLADLTIITSDNPRYEDPLAIIRDIRAGIRRTSGKYVEICDRREAVRYAVANAQRGDVIVLAGKGHEDYQEIMGVRCHMDDREIVRDACSALSGHFAQWNCADPELPD